MNFKLIRASHEYETVIKNLLQFYTYDFSEFVQCDVEENGLYAPYPGLEDYWTEENHSFPYIIKKDGKYAGFVFVRCVESGEQSYFSIAEFFIMRKYRRGGIGKEAAEQVFNLHKGQWEVHQRESNKPARLFWTRVIDEYTKGQFRERLENGRTIQNFEN